MQYSREYGEEDSGGELLDFSNEAAFEEQVQKLNRGKLALFLADPHVLPYALSRSIQSEGR